MNRTLRNQGDRLKRNTGLAKVDFTSIKKKLPESSIIKNREGFPQSVKGKILVTWIIENKFCKSREEAVIIGQELIDSQFIVPLQSERLFKDEKILYGLNKLQTNSNSNVVSVHLNDKLQLESVFNYEAELEKEYVKKFSHENLVQIPTNDVQVKYVERKLRTLNASVPENFVLKLVDANVRDCIQVFTQPFTTVKWGQESLPVFSSIDFDSYPDLVFELDKQAEPDLYPLEKLDPLLLQSTDKIKEDFLIKRQISRHKLFDVINIFSREIKNSSQLEISPPQERVDSQLYVSCKSIDFAIRDLEPYFCHITIYDRKERRRVSETFSFEYSSDFTRSLLKKASDDVHPFTNLRETLFNLKDRNPDYILLVTIEKILQGNIDQCLETYQKFSTFKEKEKAKIFEDTRLSCTKFSAYRQLMAWGYIELFDDAGDLLLEMDSSFKETHLTNVLLYAAKSDTNHLFNIHFNEKDLKKMKPFLNAVCALEIRIIDPLQSPLTGYTCLTSSLTFLSNVNPSSVNLSSQTEDKFILEMKPFSYTNDEMLPNLSYFHDLYVYPEYLNFSNTIGKTIAITISFLETDQELESPPLNVIFARCANADPLTSTTTATVFYHNKKPEYYDEIKIRLPPKLTPRHHIFFTFHHIHCKSEKKIESGLGKLATTIIGYAKLPVFESSKIIDNMTHKLPVSFNLLPDYLNPYCELKWIENKKPLFEVRTRMESSILPQDLELNTFLKQNYSKELNDGSYDENILFKSLSNSDSEELIRFFPVIMKQFFQVVIDPKTSLNKAFSALLETLRRIRLFERKTKFYFPQLFQSYIQYFHYIPIQEQLIKMWCEGLSTSNDSWQFSSFFFELIIKSMILSVEEEKNKSNTNSLRLNISGLKSFSRSNRFSPSIVENLQKLVFGLTVILTNLSDDLEQLNLLNKSLAKFIRDLFAIMDPSNVFSLIQIYFIGLNNTNLSEAHLEHFDGAKLDFLTILVEYEHYVPLNLPVDITIDFIPQFKFSYKDSHLLARLLLNQVALTLTNSSKINRQKAITILRNLLRKHELDPRYQSVKQREQIAGLYLPLLGIITDHIKEIETYIINEKQKWLICLLFVIKNANRSLIRDWLKQEASERQVKFIHALSLCIETFEFTGKKILESDEEILKNKQTLTVSPSQRKEFIESAYGKKLENSKRSRTSSGNNTPKKSSLPEYNTEKFKDQKSESRPSSQPEYTKIFHENGEQKDKTVNLDETKLTDSQSTNEESKVEEEHKTHSNEGRKVSSSSEIKDKKNSNEDSNFSSRSDYKIYGTYSNSRSGSQASKNDKRSSGSGSRREFSKKREFATAKKMFSHSDRNLRQEKYLSHEVSLIAFDILHDLLDDAQKFLNEEGNPVLISIVSFFVLSLKKSYPQNSILLLISLLRLFISTFGHPLFLYRTTFIADLSFEILRLCNSPDHKIRAGACTLLYLFLMENYKVTKDIFRTKLNISINISKLIGTSDTPPELSLLKQSLESIVQYIKSHKQDENFAGQVLSLIGRLLGILHDTQLISHHRYDPEMTADLFYQISIGYTDSPQLRVSYLEHLYSAHKQDKNWEEAALALIGKIAIIVDYINTVCASTKIKGFPTKEQFLKISPNILKERELDFSSKEESVIHSSEFTQERAMTLLERVVGLFKAAEMFELSIETYNLLIPYYQSLRNYEILQKMYSDSSEICKQLIVADKSRIFSNYYRVCFYGKPFGELNGVEFIYKQKILLAAMVTRLKQQIAQKYKIKEEEVVLLPNTLETVKQEDVNDGRCYFQVIFAQIYFDQNVDLAERQTPFQKSFNIDTFYYEVPFTKTGNAQTEDVSQQFKLKRIVKTELAFPYLKSRLRIQESKSIILNPIENSIEAIDSRCKSLQAELDSNPPDLKRLQHVLQGSVLAQVNVGPLRICQVFLNPKKPSEYSSELVQKLRDVMEQFVDLCNKGIELNGKLIQKNQHDFQQALLEGYENLKAYLEGKFDGTLRNLPKNKYTLESIDVTEDKESKEEKEEKEEKENQQVMEEGKQEEKEEELDEEEKKIEKNKKVAKVLGTKVPVSTETLHQQFKLGRFFGTDSTPAPGSEEVKDTRQKVRLERFFGETAPKPGSEEASNTRKKDKLDKFFGEDVGEEVTKQRKRSNADRPRGDSNFTKINEKVNNILSEIQKMKAQTQSKETNEEMKEEMEEEIKEDTEEEKEEVKVEDKEKEEDVPTESIGTEPEEEESTEEEEPENKAFPQMTVEKQEEEEESTEEESTEEEKEEKKRRKPENNAPHEPEEEIEELSDESEEPYLYRKSNTFRAEN